jgi:hypothetical protein
MMSSNRIAPRGRGEIRVTFDPDNYNGSVTKEIWVFSNDPKNPKAILTIRAEVVRQE